MVAVVVAVVVAAVVAVVVVVADDLTPLWIPMAEAWERA